MDIHRSKNTFVGVTHRVTNHFFLFYSFPPDNSLRETLKFHFFPHASHLTEWRQICQRSSGGARMRSEAAWSAQFRFVFAAFHEFITISVCASLGRHFLWNQKLIHIAFSYFFFSYCLHWCPSIQTPYLWEGKGFVACKRAQKKWYIKGRQFLIEMICKMYFSLPFLCL